MITIDPNLRGCGVAIWRGGELLSASYVKNPFKTGRGYAVHAAMGQAVGWHLRGNAFSQAFIEHPRVYPGMPDKDLNDLLDVAAVGAAVAADSNFAACLFDHGARVQTVFPSDWKGNVKKQVMLDRIKSKLTEAELERCVFTNKSDNKDVLDAIGIGLWKLGRLNAKSYPGAT